ncbi:MAG: CesT family type III secretion system chaperone [Puniceicoccales bacterium]|jgi:hypothetical protein|nr:CesT family type III secretion system chaperone [Puniceicoccales bacterium]
MNMQVREQVDLWLKTLSATSGKMFRLNEKGIFASTDESGQEFIVEVPDASDQVYFCAPIATVPENNKAACLERLLQWNLYGLRTQYCTLGLEENTNRIIMHYSMEVAYLECQTFINVFNNFIERVRKIKQDWEQFLRDASTGGSTALPDINMLRI